MNDAVIGAALCLLGTFLFLFASTTIICMAAVVFQIIFNPEIRNKILYQCRKGRGRLKRQAVTTARYKSRVQIIEREPGTAATRF